MSQGAVKIGDLEKHSEASKVVKPKFNKEIKSKPFVCKTQTFQEFAFLPFFEESSPSIMMARKTIKAGRADRACAWGFQKKSSSEKQQETQNEAACQQPSSLRARQTIRSQRLTA